LIASPALLWKSARNLPRKRSCSASWHACQSQNRTKLAHGFALQYTTEVFFRLPLSKSFSNEVNAMIEYRYDTQLLIEGKNLDEDKIYDYFVENFIGDSLLAVGDEELIKIHYHTNEPWKVLEYCASLGEIYDIVVEDMDRQSRGLQG